MDYFGTQSAYSVLAFDNRGVGSSDAPNTWYTTKEMAQDTLELLQRVGWTQGVHVVGASMGGMIAQELALLCPDGMIQSLTLVSTSATPPLPTWKAIQHGWQTRGMSKYQQLVAAADLLFPQDYLDMVQGDKTNRQLYNEFMEKRVNAVKQPPAPGQLSAVIRHRLSNARLQQLRERVSRILVVSGDEDNIVPHHYSQHLAKQLGCPLHIVHRGGHVIGMQCPDEFHALLTRQFQM
jgi:pimeloyl-ACP methyl ester carboxylesterase